MGLLLERAKQFLSTPPSEGWMTYEYLTQREGEALRRFVEKRLPRQFQVVEDWEGEWGFSVARRYLPYAGEEGTWIHVVNNDVGSLSRWLNDFSRIEGEVCCSQVGDWLLHTRRTFLAVVMEGCARAVFDEDVWSKVDARGVRVATREGSGNPSRCEAWVVPSECRIVTVVTDSDELVEEAHRVGFSVVVKASRESLCCIDDCADDAAA